MNYELRTANSLLGKSALVTGGAKRIGRAIALALAGAGADVTITFRGSGDEAVETVDAIEQLGRRGFALECNVRSQQSVRHAVASTVAEHGRLDILVNNAAIFESADLDQITLEQWDAIFETNTRGPFLFAREAIPHLRATRGRIINMGSLGGLHPWADHGHYCSSKAAVHMLTKCMAKAFGPEVAVNAVAPGWIDMDAEPTEQTRRMVTKTPLRRTGTPQDIAAAVLYFASSASFITGQIMPVDGGLGL
ncbi:SDR family NAD(P)-dependent oxidoreductase [Occallatibacter riparius]|uniref:SDR family oxidoreductase n=1 Tax=Occallatibacter riparius TaxID=1002689 RepID=A0A9J7BGP4_9BACT|nr:SDR family NAD(P)-dependent oxidoreductase [Occallatibacter riparius]UWZ82148.1 SDR family oxidoreductase [Occallatibacter riparius]